MLILTLHQDNNFKEPEKINKKSDENINETDRNRNMYNLTNNKN